MRHRVQDMCAVCLLHWSSWQPGTTQEPEGLELLTMYEAISDPEGQPRGHYHQVLVSPWHVAIAAHGKTSDNHVIVLGKASCHVTVKIYFRDA